MKVTITLLLFTALLLGGCASNHLGSYAQFESANGPVSPLQISARFNQRACSDYFAYIDISIHNPSGTWQKVTDIQFDFPFSKNNQFSVMEGERLKNWADSERRRRAHSEYNSGLASLAVSVIGLGLMTSDSKSTRNAGAALALGSGINSSAKEISSDINTMETARSTSNNYFTGNNIEIAPGMTRKFWLVLNATDEAPLMAWLGASFSDNENQKQVFKAPLANWQACGWQSERKKYLKTLSKNRPGRGVVSGGPSNNRRVNSAFSQGYLLDAELKLMEEAATEDQDEY